MFENEKSTFFKMRRVIRKSWEKKKLVIFPYIFKMSIQNKTGEKIQSQNYRCEPDYTGWAVSLLDPTWSGSNKNWSRAWLEPRIRLGLKNKALIVRLIFLFHILQVEIMERKMVMRRTFCSVFVFKLLGACQVRKRRGFCWRVVLMIGNTPTLGQGCWIKIRF